MPSCCRTCDHRNHAVNTVSLSPTLLDVCLITLSFKTPVSTFNPTPYAALNAVLNNITDAAENTSHPSRFTSWSPCLEDPKTAIIVTTLSETCQNSTSPLFSPVLRHLSNPPTVQHILLDYSAIALASSSPDEKIAFDIIVVNAPNATVAGAIGKRFGWDPKRSSLSAMLAVSAPAGFSRPGDLVRDFWAWTELPGEPVSPSSSYNSEYEGVLKSTNSDEKNMAMFLPRDSDSEKANAEDETLVMVFEWSNRVDAERFKHPLQKSYGYNQQSVSPDLWDRHVANPVRQLEGIGAKVQHYKVELRGVEERIETGKPGAARERSGSRRLSVMASGMGERLSGFWR
ncbi:uncharacterized protein BDR25DRAFT_22627 [Lindgomyces ingoldianus]|uniref:Uncharacterized protein n=1 Tax=Lindgomyces ingoldianus TaxID=673940 RepID=A0ACB6QXY2_9PLEO|nr:uncharacterized protein BDR25DRAFT_22627 [Lindgomyces ingoldianus]KAF2471746.1 hypothetical protein BDR25DRAFT_22627 [Lindgomyces ingoldianus]